MSSDTSDMKLSRKLRDFTVGGSFFPGLLEKIAFRVFLIPNEISRLRVLQWPNAEEREIL